MSDTPAVGPSAPQAPSAPSAPAADWYPDPEIAGGQRWWDGQAWTDHRQPPLAIGAAYGPGVVQVYGGAAPAGAGGEPPLWAPWYGISFANAIRRAWKKYAAFDGRASLSEYWWFTLFTALISLGGYVVFWIAIGIAFATGGVGIALAVLVGIAYLGLGIALIIPSIAITIRRLHDAGYSGLLFLLALVPFGSIVIIVFTLLPSSPSGIQYDRPA